MFNKKWELVVYIANNPAKPTIVSTHYTLRGAARARSEATTIERARRQDAIEAATFPTEMARFQRMRGYKYRVREKGWL